jgi:prepilin-type N-terminal cleavage/methylation domain-containing protein/prepilin-type processing-associated H-X9-DG protein
MKRPSFSTHFGASKPRGFTLIELLTVIAIIGILAAIIIPTVSMVRSSAKTSKCIAQLRQLGMAYLLYADTNKGVMVLSDTPGGTNGDPLWHVTLARSGLLLEHKRNDVYADNIFNCPETVPYLTNPATPSYGVVFEHQRVYKRVSNILNPSRTWMIGEVTRGGSPANGYKGWYRCFLPPSSGYPDPIPSGDVYSPATRHGNFKKVNVAMFDGHVESLTLAQINVQDGGKFRYFQTP